MNIQLMHDTFLCCLQHAFGFHAYHVVKIYKEDIRSIDTAFLSLYTLGMVM